MANSPPLGEIDNNRCIPSVGGSPPAHRINARVGHQPTSVE
jgi:hypothetical protein